MIIDNGTMKLSVVPTRGMSVLQASVGDVRMGWDSPVKGSGQPGLHRTQWRGGPGWLEGFNELVTRCGYEWVGHPGMDKALKQVSEIQDGARLKCDRRRWLI